MSHRNTRVCCKCGRRRHASFFRLFIKCIDCEEGRVEPENLQVDEAFFERRTFNNYLKCVYGTNVETYERLLEEQNGLCAICRKPELAKSRLAVDHDHDTGEVRGLLCGRCNTAIGLLREDPEIIDRAKSYIMEHKAWAR